jgi:hypothetical protein
VRTRWIAGCIGSVLVLGACTTTAAAPEADDVYDGCRIAPRTTCRDARLDGLVLENVDLRGADLRGTSFAAAILRGADLRGADLRGADFRGADLGGADLRGADLRGANLSFAATVGADLRDAKTAGVVSCLQLRPDWGLDVEGCGPAGPAVPTTRAPRARGPTEILEFRVLSRRCLNDAAGTAVEVRYRVRNARVVVFRLDGVQALTVRRARGMVRVPFICDGRDRTLTLEVYGAVPPPRERSLVLARRPGLTPAPPG